MLTLAVLPAAALLALAFATPAHADDQSPPPVLMLGKSAVIAPDEPDATTVAADAVPPEPASAPAPVVEQSPTRAVATDGWELAAKPHQWRRVVHHVPPAAAPRETPSAVISRPARTVHRVRAHHAVSRASGTAAAAPSRWYQVDEGQYRHARAGSRVSPQNGVSLAVQPGYVPQAGPSRAGPRLAQTVCAFHTERCVQLCPSYAAYKVTQNGRWIGVCNYVPVAMPGLDRLHAKLLERLWLLALNARAGVSAIQYQCLASQYQRETCSAPPQSSGARATAREPVRARAHDQTVSRRHAVAEPEGVAAVEGRKVARVLAAVATRESHGAKAVHRSVHRSPVRAAATKPSGTPEAAPSAGSADSPDDWFLRTLVVLTGAGILAFLLAALSQNWAPATGLTGVRSRVRSRGLSASRVVLGEGAGERTRRRGRIAYRD
jgi:hypothetical protein